jgi:SH3 domain-containing YSC84-like protein 1
VGNEIKCCFQVKEQYMKRLFTVLSCLALVGTLLGTLAWGASEHDDAVARLKNSAEVLKAVASNPDKGIPDEVVARSKCIVVIPNLVKAGLVVGGKYGRGVAVCRTNARANSGWSAPAFITIGGGSIGAQVGAEGIDLVMVVMNDKGVQRLLATKTEFTLEGSVAAGPVGKHVSVGSDSSLDSEILTYSRTKGVFAGQALEGASVGQDQDATTAIYGSEIPLDKILGGQVAAPSPAAPLLHEVAELSREAAAQQARQQTPQRMNK